MNQEEEIVFSLKKFKRVFHKYWYIILITFLLGLGCVAVMTAKAMSNSSSASAEASASAATQSTTKATTQATTAAPQPTTVANIQYVVDGTSTT